MTELTREQMYALVRSHGAEKDVDQSMVCGALAESGWRTDASGDNGHSWGLFQLHDAGLGAGMSVAARCDPDQATARMLPEYRRAFYTEAAAGYTDRELIVRTCLRAERPLDWQNPASIAAQGYRLAYARSLPPETPEAPPEPAPSQPGLSYDPDLPAVYQDDPWSCSVCTTTWALQSLGIGVTEPQMEAAMLAAGLVSPALGLLDGSGAQLQAWLETEWGAPVERAYPADWDALTPWCGAGPILLGGIAWNHWAAVRRGDADGLQLANPAPSWQGVGDHLSRAEWQRWGPWAALWIPAAVEEDPMAIAELEAQVADLTQQLAACQSYSSAVGHDIIQPTVAEMDAQLAAQGVRKGKAPEHWATLVTTWADRLRPHIVP